MILCCLTLDNSSKWVGKPLWAKFTHNTLHHSALVKSPFEAQFRYRFGPDHVASAALGMPAVGSSVAGWTGLHVGSAFI